MFLKIEIGVGKKLIQRAFYMSFYKIRKKNKQIDTHVYR